MGRSVGIDLGTTNSVIAVLEGGEPVVIANAEGARTTPSVVAFARDGHPLVGEIAKRQAVTNVDRTLRSVKRQMGTSWTVDVDGRPRSAQELSALVLAKLKRDAEAYLGEEVTEAVITVPAYFNDAQRQATKEAGEIAGLVVRRIINEPTAAALAYAADPTADLTAGQTVLVFDLGGGTLDVSVLSLDRDPTGFTTVQVLATAGDNELGGDDFDTRLVALLADRFGAATGVNVRTDPVAAQRLAEAAEVAKVTLSTGPAATVTVPYLTVVGSEPLHLAETVTRAAFEAATADLLARCRAPFAQALTDAGLAVGDLDHVILVGGSTRMPAVADLVRQLSDRPPVRGAGEDEVIACGAALQAAVLAGHRNDVLLLDVTPLTLGIETRDGLLSAVIDRNTAVPVRRTRTFTTSTDEQQVVQFRIFQGEQSRAAENVCLGTFELTGLPRAPKGIPQIEVAFDLDADGILTVSATELGTGTVRRLAVSRPTNLSRSRP